MNELTRTTDVWAPATQQDQIACLALLAGLPAREADGDAVDKAAYYLALEGVTKFGLREAVKAILQGKHGHGFFPSPPELRMQCDAAMEHHVRMRERIARQERIDAERTAPRREPTEDEKARVSAMIARFHASLPKREELPEFDWSRVHERFDRKDAAE